MNCSAKTAKMLNWILGIIYIPLSLFSWLMQMVSVNTIEATNLLYTTLISVFCGISFLIPALCIIGTILSIVFRKKDRSILSIIFQISPSVVFLLNMILFCVAEALLKT